jgi:hypothetical protein
MAGTAYWFLPLAIPLPWSWATVTSTLPLTLLPSLSVHVKETV